MLTTSLDIELSYIFKLAYLLLIMRKENKIYIFINNILINEFEY